MISLRITLAMVSVRVLEHAIKGALVVGGSATLLQALVARQLQRPGSVALALTTFVGVFRLLEDSDRDGKKAGDTTSSPRAAAIAAAAALAVLDAKRRGFVVSLACAEAAIEVAQRVPFLKDIKHIEFIVGAAMYTQLVYTWIYRPDLYSPSQLSTLDRFTLRPKAVTHAMREQFPSGTMTSRCDVWHPGQASCTEYHIQDFMGGVPQLMRLYLPIFIVTAGLLKWKRWVKGPRPPLVQTALQFVRTCVSLKLSSQLGVIGSCYLPMKNHELATYCSGVLTTLCLLFESERRRAGAVKTVALYVLCTSGTWTSRKLQLSESSRASWQFVLVAAAFAALFQHPQRQNAQLMKLLYGRDVHVRKRRKEDQSSATTTVKTQTTQESDF